MAAFSVPPPELYPAAGLLLVAFAVLAARRRAGNPAPARALALAALAGCLGLSAQYAAARGWLALPAGVSAGLPRDTLFLVTWAAGPFVIRYARGGRRASWGWLAALLPVAATLALDIIHPKLLIGNVASYAMVAVWAGMLLALSGLSARRYAQARQPLHRNRLLYLTPALALLAAAGALAFGGLALAALISLVLAVGLMTLMAVVHQLPDLRRILRRVLSYLIQTALTAALFAAGFWGTGRVLEGGGGYTPVWIGALIAAALAILFNPLLTTLRRGIDRLLAGSTYNPSQVVSDYARHTSNVLDVRLLAILAVGSIRETLQVDYGCLALVDLKEELPRRGYYLQAIEIECDAGLRPGFLDLHSPIADELTHERQPLTQYDLDLLPDYQRAGEEELSWFHATGMDVYIPIVAHEHWIGLIMLGPKRSGERYSPEDLLLLSALAGHTAVSLENARLVSHLEALNADLKTTSSTLEAARQKLERLDKVKSDFISIASHELRTPLTLILGYVDFLSMSPAAESDEALRKAADGIQSGALRMQEIVESMLDVARIDNSALELHICKINLPAVARAVRGGLEDAVRERCIQFTVIEEGELPGIEADPTELQKVLQHLYINAIKYTPDGGCVEVILRELEAGESPLARPSVQIQVIDTGIGIAPETSELIFKKFYQTGPLELHSSGRTKFKGGGPGLGLAVARGIVEAHNGVIWVESDGYDEVRLPGSRFYVVLPVTQTALTVLDRPTVPLNSHLQ